MNFAVFPLLPRGVHYRGITCSEQPDGHAGGLGAAAGVRLPGLLLSPP